MTARQSHSYQSVYITKKKKKKILSLNFINLYNFIPSVQDIRLITVVSEAPSVETSLSDDLLCLPSALMSTIIYDYVSFLVGLRPLHGPCSL